MRELKDYFCTYRQTKQLMALGIIGVEHLKHITPSNEILHQLSESCLGAILRSQALDYFRDLGYILEQRKTIDLKYYYYIFNQEKEIAVSTDMILDWVIAESGLIDKLIELEKEARYGN